MIDIKVISLLQMMAFVAASSVNEKRLMDSTKLKLIPDAIQKDADIIIKIFDELQIIISRPASPWAPSPAALMPITGFFMR